MNRHDFTKAQRDLLNFAVRIDVVDAVELGCMLAHGANFATLDNELTEAAFSDYHCAEGNAKHAVWCDARDAYYAATRTV